MKVFRFTHNNFVIQVSRPTIEDIQASVEMLSFFMPKEFVDDVMDVFKKKLAEKDYEIVEEENKKINE